MDKKSKIAAGVGSILALLIGYFGYQTYHYVSTDNALVQAPATLVSTRISGIVEKIHIQENERVKKGQLLAEINSEDYQATFDHLTSEAESLQEQLRGAKISYDRSLKLFKTGAMTQEKLDNAETQYKTLVRKLKSAEAQVTGAKLNVDSTRIIAPSDGKVGRKSFEVGMYVNPGQPLYGFVDGSDRWIVANLKETDMENVREGNTAMVSVDALSGKEFEGRVEGISPATGATFSLLPPDNATGNFTKVVQRVPVRIKLLNLTESDIDRLQAGLSAEVKIKIR